MCVCVCVWLCVCVVVFSEIFFGCFYTFYPRTRFATTGTQTAPNRPRLKRFKKNLKALHRAAVGRRGLFWKDMRVVVGGGVMTVSTLGPLTGQTPEHHDPLGR